MGWLQDLFGFEDPKKVRGTQFDVDPSNAPLPVIYGQPGQITPLFRPLGTSGKNNLFLYGVYIIGEGEMTDFGQMTLDDKVFGEFDSHSVSYGPSFASYTDSTRVVLRCYLGTTGQTADSMLTTNVTGFTSTCTAKGVAYIAARFRFHRDWFAVNGQPPVLKCIPRGLKLYDPRDASTAYSTNGVLAVYDYLTDGIYGKGLTNVNSTAAIAAANDADSTDNVLAQVNLGSPDLVTDYSDAGVTLFEFTSLPGAAFVLGNANIQNAVSSPAKTATLLTAYNNNVGQTGTYKFHLVYEQLTGTAFTTGDTLYADATAFSLYECNGIIDTEQEIFANVKELLLGIRGRLPYIQGEYHIAIEQDGAVDYAFDESHLASNSMTIRAPNKKDKFNRVTATYINPNANFTEDQVMYPDPGSATETTFLAEDNGAELHKEITLNTVTNKYQARELCRLICELSRDEMTFEATFMSEAISRAPGDIVTLTHSTPGWVDQEFKVKEVGLLNSGEVDLVLTKHTGSLYTYESIDQDLLKPDTTLPDVFYVEPPTGLSLSVVAGSSNIGTLVPTILVDFTAAADEFVERYEVSYKLSTESDWQSFVSRDLDETSLQIIGLSEAGTYDVRMRASNSLGISSAWTATVQQVLTFYRAGANNFMPPRFAGAWKDVDQRLPVATGVDITNCLVYSIVNASHPASGYYGTHAMKIITADTATTDRVVWFGSGATDYKFPIVPNWVWLARAKAWPVTANTDVTWVVKTVNTTVTNTNTIVTAGDWNDWEESFDLSADAADKCAMSIEVNERNQVLWLDGLLFEPRQGNQTVANDWRPPLASNVAPSVVDSDLLLAGALPEGMTLTDGDISMGLAHGTEIIYASDGDTVTFTDPYSSPPMVAPLPGGRVGSGSTADQYYVAEAVDVETTGFTAIVELRVANDNTITSETDDNSGAGSVNFDTNIEDMPKDIATEAWDLRYTFQFDVTVNNSDQQKEGTDTWYQPGRVVVGIWVAFSSGAWTQVGTREVRGKSDAATTTKTNLTYTAIVDALGTHAGYEFRVSIISDVYGNSTLDSFDNVTYQTATAKAGTVTGTPPGVPAVPFLVTAI